jgi:diguanylate cyclase (GGDEF)-like protein/PAS domain S-box-containing protein
MNPLLHAPRGLGELLDILPDAVVVVDERSLIVYANPAVRSLLGYTPEELVERPLSQLLPPAVRERHEQWVARFRREGRSTLMGNRPVLHALHKSGKPVALSISLCNLTLEGAQRVSVALMHDVSTLQTDLDRATQTAQTDSLTGASNRLGLSRRLQALLAAQRRLPLLYFDLTAFKPLNDRWGHEAGDEVLGIVAKRALADVRGADVVARIGGDEFVVLVDLLDDPVALQARASAMAEHLTLPMHLKCLGAGAPPLSVGVSIGGAIHPTHGATEPDLLAAADRAMYQAKQAGVRYRLAPD